MRISWYGHSCFVLDFGKGMRIATDPYPQKVFRHSKPSCDAVTISHAHYDHNDLTQLDGNPMVIETPERNRVGEVQVWGIPTFHDDKRGALRGNNIVFVYDCGGKRIVHLGDLGCMLTDDQIKSLGAVDALLIPIGGTYTIGPKEAVSLMKLIAPVYCVPLHYHMEGHAFPLKTAKDFVTAAKGSGDMIKLLVPESDSLQV